jgi:hypothetical protein
MKAWFPFFKNPFRWFIVKIRLAQQARKHKRMVKEVARGLMVLQVIDTYIVKQNYNRHQQKQFWTAFFKGAGTRKAIFQQIEKALSDGKLI